MAADGKDDVGGIALAALEIAAAEVPVALHVTDDRPDGGAAREIAFDPPKTPRFWPKMKTYHGFSVLVAAIALVDLGALDWAAGELLGGFDDIAPRVAVIWVARQGLGMQYELAVPRRRR